MNLRKFGVKLLAGLALLSATAPTTAAFAQEDKEPILVGANYELSGYSASYGVALFEALELAVEQVNANGGLLDGRPVELVYADINDSISKLFRRNAVDADAVSYNCYVKRIFNFISYNS